MVRPNFSNDDFLDAALTVAVDRGPAAVTVGSITQLLKAPTGSFYHRFTSRDVLLAELWLRTVLAFQEGARAAVEAADWLGAALHTPRWVRDHLDEGRLLLLYHRDDFIQGEWPVLMREAVAAQAARFDVAHRRFASEVLGDDGPRGLRCAQFVLAEAPVAAVRQHLRRREPPPEIVDELIRITFEAVVRSFARP
ncbi:MAG TPA: helix-turn-helix domain-containing protein [Stellaceae bacterium]|nr:helix-turn-helix domain-containing protein [Stellaceae bacterium]